MNDFILWKNGYGFSRKYVRDLAWVIGSEPLLSSVNSESFVVPDIDFCSSELEEILPILRRMEDGFELFAKNRLLGVYFEQLVADWIGLKPGVSKMITNLQVIRDRRTVGELDLLFCEHDVWNHWELAVKFYLGVGNTLFEDNWIGPSVNDRLSVKLKRTSEVLNTATQFAESELAVQGIVNPVSSLWMKGRLFHHFKAERRLPLGVNENCEQFVWMHRGEALEILENDSLWTFGNKLDWLTAPVIKEHDDKIQTGKQIKQWLQSLRGSHKFFRLLYEYVNLGHTHLSPVNQVMITHDGWPD